MASFFLLGCYKGAVLDPSKQSEVLTEGSRREDGGCQPALALGFQYTGYYPLVTDFDSKDLCGHSLFTKKR